MAGDARHVEQLARWWTSASQEARSALLTKATKENRPPLQTLQLAIVLAERAFPDNFDGLAFFLKFLLGLEGAGMN